MQHHKKIIAEKVMQIITANWIAQPLYVVTKLGIPVILAEGPKSSNELAEITGTYEPFLYRVMRALSSVGFFHEEKDRVFGITPMGEILQKDKMQPIVLMFLSDWHANAWAHLLKSVKTGKIAFECAYGRSAFEWLAKHEEAAEVFNKANELKAIQSHAAVVDMYDFSKVNSIVDIGGGYGGLLFCILFKNPHLKGIIADLPYMKEKVEQGISANELSDRCVFIACDFFQEIPADHDCYILSNILHDWDDEKCQTTLSNCHNAMGNSARLLIIESILPKRNEFTITSLMDLEVMVMGGGKERTESEYQNLLYGSGFLLKKIIQTKDNISIIECMKK
ncbi:MAG: methyltransferase [Candidatus Cloacimonetes bacterium]|nr:methyltransferase [Candidatus Cloacimonadota bacterium]